MVNPDDLRLGDVMVYIISPTKLDDNKGCWIFINRDAAGHIHWLYTNHETPTANERNDTLALWKETSVVTWRHCYIVGNILDTFSPEVTMQFKKKVLSS